MRVPTSIVIFTFSIILSICMNSIQCKKGKEDKEEVKSQTFPPCAACRVLTNSFKKGLEKTSRGKFEGGDSAWEEDKLGSYSKSEIRLIEIQENLCKEVEHGETQCHSLAEELEAPIEEWWFKYQDIYPDIYDYICIERTKHCCPKEHYGSDCMPCPGYPDNVCSNNGKCKGAGTRKGNGSCLCDKGYVGDICSQCAPGYYESYKNENTLLCSACHMACEGPCKDAGPSNCEKCATGWYMVEGQGCFDIDECLKSDNVCASNQFCVNKEGSYTCLACDKACDGCNGDGPDMCTKCIEGYTEKDNLCINTDLFGRKKQENLARYMTYVGLCVATCIILQRNIYAASVIGLLVALYISISEYMIANSNVQDTTANMDILKAV
ncbi:cysteine-rich with EGF-like domain protein 2 [Ooceraea biroi]|uniref:cysteine-rich with EGF-like domain protein 2 n=1 Tax=Ooceraea biroi TaxID=2015173 RepID=UPI000F075A3F|nr:cysteine-rich with EGF-like domain protein 2 [Ooceraea biroi]